MTFAIVGVVVDHTAEDGGLVITSTKKISVEIRCEGELLGRLINLFQQDSLPDARYMFAKDFSAGQAFPLQKISFVGFQDMADFLREKFESFEIGSRHFFVICHQDDIKVISATVGLEGILLEDVDPDSKIDGPATLYSSQPITI